MPESKRMTMDEVMSAINEIAKDSTDRDRFRALKLIADSDAKAASLPTPLNRIEVMDRLIRLFRCIGPETVRRAYRATWKKSKHDIQEIATDELADEIGKFTTEEHELVLKCYGLKQLYRHFPEIMPPTGGVPNGFPFRGKLVQMEWCRKQAVRLIRDRRRAALTAGKGTDAPKPEG